MYGGPRNVKPGNYLSDTSVSKLVHHDRPDFDALAKMLVLDALKHRDHEL
jgi:hypothetical protein